MVDSGLDPITGELRVSGDGYDEDHASINASANAFLETAGLLKAGRVNLDTATLTRVPYAHPDVGDAVRALTMRVDDVGADAVLLLTALSTRLKDTAQGYSRADEQTQAEFDTVLAEGSFTHGNQ
jgi:hypothetical protein